MKAHISNDVRQLMDDPDTREQLRRVLASGGGRVEANGHSLELQSLSLSPTLKRIRGRLDSGGSAPSLKPQS